MTQIIRNLIERITRLEQRLDALESGEYPALASLKANGDIKHVDGYVPDLRWLRYITYMTFDNVEDFESTPAGWSWAGSPFVTPPSAGTVAGTALLIFRYTSNSLRSFFFRPISDFLQVAFYGGALTSSNGSYLGVRIDDGTDNNYFEVVWLYSETSPRGYNAAVRNRVGGGTVSVTQSPHRHEVIPTNVGLLVTFGGTKWTNWGIDARVQSLGVTKFGGAYSLTWTPQRLGVVVNSGNGAASWHNYYIDAVYYT